jgi:hypothetical protein
VGEGTGGATGGATGGCTGGTGACAAAEGPTTKGSVLAEDSNKASATERREEEKVTS